MRIMLISSLFGIDGGGAGIMAYHLAHGLMTMGHSVSVITMGKNRRYVIEVDQGLRIYRFLPRNLYPLQGKDARPDWQKMIWQIIDIYNPDSVNGLSEILKKEAPDIVHINKMRGFSGGVWTIATTLCPGRVIQTCHDYESMSPDGIMRGIIGKMVIEKTWHMRIYQRVRAYMSRRISMVTAPSRFALQRIQESGLFPFADAAVIPNTHGFSHNPLQAKQKLFTRGVKLLYIGRLEEEKGIGVLCEAFEQSLKYNASLRLDIAGSGSFEHHLRKKYSRTPGIRFLGLVDGRAKEDVLANATVVVVPSLVDEVFGIASVEAFAYGKPVIASKVGGLPEIVDDGETGWLFESGDVSALKDIILNVASLSLEYLSEMGAKCLSHAAIYSKDNVLASFEKIYVKLLDTAKR